MAERRPLIEFAAADDTRRAIEDWQRWIAAERRSSDNTLAAYSRDVAAFLRFLNEHLGTPATLADLNDLAAADFRSFLARRAGEQSQQAEVEKTRIDAIDHRLQDSLRRMETLATEQETEAPAQLQAELVELEQQQQAMGDSNRRLDERLAEAKQRAGENVQSEGTTQAEDTSTTTGPKKGIQPRTGIQAKEEPSATNTPADVVRTAGQLATALKPPVSKNAFYEALEGKDLDTLKAVEAEYNSSTGRELRRDIEFRFGEADERRAMATLDGKQATADAVALTQAMAEALRPYDVRVNAVSPGAIEPRTADRRGETPQRKVTQADVANLCAYLASDLAASITGSNFEAFGNTHTVIKA